MPPPLLKVLQHFQLFSGIPVNRFRLSQFQLGDHVVHVIRLLVHFDKPVSVPRQLEAVLNEWESVLVAEYCLLEFGTLMLVPDADASLL